MIAGVPTKVLDLLAKLKARTIDAGCTPAEAAKAAEAMTTILAKYQLSIADIPEGKTGEPIVEVDYKSVSRLRPAKRQYAATIGGAWRCMTLSNAHEITFVGHKSDAAVASFFFETTYDRVRSEAMRQARLFGKKGHDLVCWCDDFVMSAAVAVFNRMRDFGGESYGALVHLKEARVDEYVAESYPQVKSRKAASLKADSTARINGIEFGNSMSITPGVEDDRPSLALAGSE